MKKRNIYNNIVAAMRLLYYFSLLRNAMERLMQDEARGSNYTSPTLEVTI